MLLPLVAPHDVVPEYDLPAYVAGVGVVDAHVDLEVGVAPELLAANVAGFNRGAEDGKKMFVD